MPIYTLYVGEEEKEEGEEEENKSDAQNSYINYSRDSSIKP